MAALDAALSPAQAPHTDANAYARTDSSGLSRLDLLVKGAHCAGCIRKIETGLLALAEVRDARLNLSTGRLSIVWSGAPDRAGDFIAKLNGWGYEAAAFDPAKSAALKDLEGRALLRRLAVAGFAAMNVMMFSVPVWGGGGEMDAGTRALMYWLSALIALPAALYAGQPFFRSALAALKAGRANMDVPISIAVILTLAMSLFETAFGAGHAYFDGVVMLLFLLLIGRYLDHRLRERARTAARDLLALQAITAQRLAPDGSSKTVAASEIAPGDLIALAAGDRAPVDGLIEQGSSDIDRAILTGESDPVPVRAGDTLQAGAINLSRPLIMRALRGSADSTVAELARLIELGEQKRALRMRIIDRAAALYVPIVHALALLTFLGWLAAGAGAYVALTNAAAVLIITCPCALGLAAPAVQIVATGRLFKQGLFVKSGDALERLADVDCVILDKTGTLTLGRPSLVTDIDAETLAAAAALARASRHPLSRALVAAAGPGPTAPGIIETPGQGIMGEIAGAPARLGARAFVAPEAKGQSHDGAELWFKRGDAPALQLIFRDTLRPDAAATVAALKARGLEVELLSGDRDDAVAAIASATGIACWRGQTGPAEKVARLEALVAAGRKCFMVGDGLNDAAALAAAHVSASPGTAIDAAQAAADLVFQSPSLMPLVEAIDVARAAKWRVIENLGFSALYNVVAIPFAVLGFVTPLIAAIAMSASSLVVSLNALRLAKGARAWTC